MKSRNVISAIAIAIGVFAFSNVQAIDPISFSTDKTVSKTEMIVEKDIKVQDWMLDADMLGARNEVSREKNLTLENWMIEGSWNKEKVKTQEPELKVEDWMLKSF
jgi:hypothetical protein